jgi:hypothetical protein
MADRRINDEPDANRDPLTKEPGSHPIGTAAGSAAGAAAGAAIGSVAGPVGTVVGGAVGAGVGGAGGHAAGEKVNPTVEEGYWRDNYTARPYYSRDFTFDDYRPAYRAGVDSWSENTGRRFDDVATDLERNWDRMKGESRLRWEQAKDAARDAWDRLDNDRTVDRTTTSRGTRSD